MRRGRLTLWFWKVHPRIYRATGGLIGRRMGFGMPVLLLDTVGRKSGARRTSAVCYMADGPRFVLIASNAGHTAHPAWLLNLRARPQARIQAGRRKLQVRARESEGGERDRLWNLMAEIYPGYDLYREKTDRHIPVVVLEPDPAPAP